MAKSYCLVAEETEKVTQWAIKKLASLYGLNVLEDCSQVNSYDCVSPIIQGFIDLVIFFAIMSYLTYAHLTIYEKKDEIPYSQPVELSMKNLV